MFTKNLGKQGVTRVINSPKTLDDEAPPMARVLGAPARRETI